MSTLVHDDPWGMTATAMPVAERDRLVGTSQQEAFWDHLQTRDANVLLEARAGSGKTTSAREGMWKLLEDKPNLSIRYCCFNKKIAQEFREKCPTDVSVGTMHAFGYEALRDSFGSNLDKNKTYTVLDGMKGGDKLPRYIRKAISSLVSQAKNHAIRPDDEDIYIRLEEFVIHFDLETWGQTDLVSEWSRKVIAKSAEMTSIVDFDDMLWMPTLHPVAFHSVDYLFIDETQDLNSVQHELVSRLNPYGRTVIIGDPFQSIYGFRGADHNSISNLRDNLDADVLPLTVSFRCPKSHVGLARQLVPDFEAAPDAIEGTINHASIDVIDHAQPGDMVLCRANAPIIKACLRALSRRQPAIVRGRAIGDTLNTVVRKIKGDTIPQFLRNLDIWKGRETAKLEARDGTEDAIEAMGDKAACIEAIGSTCGSPAEIPGVIETLFADDSAANRITFSSVHRAKGSEARNVTLIQIPYSQKRDKIRPPKPWQLDQRRNLEYVSKTRSLDTLTLIAS